MGDCPGKRRSARRERPFRGRHGANFGPNRGVRGRNREQRAAREAARSAPTRRCPRPPSRSSLSPPVAPSSDSSSHLPRRAPSWPEAPVAGPGDPVQPSARRGPSCNPAQALGGTAPLPGPASSRDRTGRTAGRSARASVRSASRNFHRLPGPGPARTPCRSVFVSGDPNSRPPARSAAASMPAAPGRSIRPQIVAVAEFRSRHEYTFAAFALNVFLSADGKTLVLLGFPARGASLRHRSWTVAQANGPQLDERGRFGGGTGPVSARIGGSEGRTGNGGPPAIRADHGHVGGSAPPSSWTGRPADRRGSRRAGSGAMCQLTHSRGSPDPSGIQTGRRAGTSGLARHCRIHRILR